MTIADRALTIYTSGTTGLPKAANVSHRRLMQWSFWFAGLMNTGAATTACTIACRCITASAAWSRSARCWCAAARCVIREKFSAQRFLGRRRRRATARCSSISASSAAISSTRRRHPRERAHRLRLCCGNGLRADVWEKFQARFDIPRILEFYAATEGNVSLYNVEGKVGAIGRVPPFLAHRFPLALVKFDADHRRAGARRRRPLHPLRDRRSRRGDRPDRRRCAQPAANSRAIPTPRTPNGKFCATCSSPATPGIAPAI